MTPLEELREIERKNRFLRDADKVEHLRVRLADQITLIAERDALKARAEKAEAERDALRKALDQIRALKPVEMEGYSYFNSRMGLEPEDVFEICDAALNRTAPEAQKGNK